MPYKKPGSVDGYTLSGHKLITVQEEDTAVRNMRADMAAMAIAAPILRRTGALWDPYEQPLGPKAVIDVNDPQELTQMQLRDVPNSINVWKQDVRMDADRLVGQNDTSLGVDSGEDNTLGEERLRAGYAEVRINLLIKRLKEPMEELWQARHVIWKRVLSDQQNGALPIMQRTVIGMQANGLDVQSIVTDGTIGPQLLEGQFWGKPKGSVETADRQRQRADTDNFFRSIAAASQVWPMLAAILNTPQATRAVLERVLYVHGWQDKQAFLGSEAQGLLQQQGQDQAMMADPRMKLLMAMANGMGEAPAGAGGAAAPLRARAPSWRPARPATPKPTTPTTRQESATGPGGRGRHRGGGISQPDPARPLWHETGLGRVYRDSHRGHSVDSHQRGGGGAGPEDDRAPQPPSHFLAVGALA
mgnify:CR=1 FL=1